MLQGKIESVLDALSVAVFVVDPDQTIVFRNAASVSVFGANIRGRKLSHFVTNKRCIRAVEDTLDGGPQVSVDVSLQLIVPTLFRMTAVRLDAEAAKHEAAVVVSFEDVSHIREAEQMRSDFVANVSHELRSPLTALYGFIETLQGAARNDQQASDRFLNLMHKEAGRMARLIDDLLSLSKLQSEERYAPTKEVNVKPILERVIATLAPITDRENSLVDAQIQPDLPTVFGSVDELTQVFSNLIENAAKYSRAEGKITVRAGVDEKEPDMIRITVTDQGDGIAPEHIPRLTERFYRIDKGRSRDKGGTGLGLAIVKHILMRHRGRLQIDSVVGQGSRFSVVLPRVRETRN
jgi:two-component system phosphate regulon sensor histidine kinase PhoR